MSVKKESEVTEEKDHRWFVKHSLPQPHEPRWQIEPSPVIKARISVDGLLAIAKAFATALPPDFSSEEIAMSVTDMLMDLCQHPVSETALDSAIEEIRAGNESSARSVLELSENWGKQG